MMDKDIGKDKDIDIDIFSINLDFSFESDSESDSNELDTEFVDVSGSDKDLKKLERELECLSVDFKKINFKKRCIDKEYKNCLIKMEKIKDNINKINKMIELKTIYENSLKFEGIEFLTEKEFYIIIKNINNNNSNLEQLIIQISNIKKNYPLWNLIDVKETLKFNVIPHSVHYTFEFVNEQKIHFKTNINIEYIE
jgi:hypothetical protein